MNCKACTCHLKMICASIVVVVDMLFCCCCFFVAANGDDMAHLKIANETIEIVRTRNHLNFIAIPKREKRTHIHTYALAVAEDANKRN